MRYDNSQKYSTGVHAVHELWSICGARALLSAFCGSSTLDEFVLSRRSASKSVPAGSAFLDKTLSVDRSQRMNACTELW